MSDYLPPLIASLLLNAAQFRTGLAEAGAVAKAETTGMGTAFNGLAAVGKVALFGTAAAVGVIGVASVKMAADFETATNRLVTSAGEQRANIGAVRDGLLQMSGEVGRSATDLAAAMYQADSAGFTYAKGGLQVVRAAAEGAAAEGADLAKVTDAVTSAMVDYHQPSSAAAQVTTTLVAAVSQGKTTFEAMTGSLHSVLPIASAAHISLAEITADVASMTVHGMSADQATQNLAHTIEHLQKTTAPQNKELALLGLNAQQVGIDLGSKGLAGTLQEIAQRITDSMGPDKQHVILDMMTALKGLPPAVQQMGEAVVNGSMSLGDFTKQAKGLNVEQAGMVHSFATLMTSTHGIGSAQQSGSQIAQTYAQALAAATGDSTTLNTALMLTGENADYTNHAIRTVAGAATEAGGHVAGWASIQATFNQKIAEAKAGIEAAAIRLGTLLIPAVSKAIDVTTGLVGWLDKNHQVLIPLAAAIGGVLLVAIGAYTVSMAMAAIATIAATWPLLLIVAAAALVAAGIALLIMHWSQVSSIMSGPVHAALSVLHPLFAAVGKAIQEAGKQLAPLRAQLTQAAQALAPIAAVIGIALGVIGAVIGALLTGAFKGLIAGLTVLLPGAIHIAVVVIDIIVAAIKLIADVVGGVINIVADLLSGDWTGAWNDAKKLVSDVGADIGRIVGDLFDLIGSIIHTALSATWAMISGFVEGVVGFFQWLFHQLVGGSIIPDLVNKTIQWFEQLPGKILDLLHQLVTDVADAATKIGTAILNGIVNALSGLGGALMGAIKGAINGIPGGAAAAHTLGIPGFASGGLITQPTLALVGEAGPELIVPLRNINQGDVAASYAPAATTSANQQQPQQTINVYVTTNADPNQIGDAVAWRLKYTT